MKIWKISSILVLVLFPDFYKFETLFIGIVSLIRDIDAACCTIHHRANLFSEALVKPGFVSRDDFSISKMARVGCCGSADTVPEVQS